MSFPIPRFPCVFPAIVTAEKLCALQLAPRQNRRGQGEIVKRRGDRGGGTREWAKEEERRSTSTRQVWVYSYSRRGPDTMLQSVGSQESGGSPHS